MAFDDHSNFAYGTVLVTPSPVTTGTAVTLNSGQGLLMPDVPFNATIWPNNAIPTFVTAEIVRVTNVAGDVLTIARHQEGTSARTIVIGDQFAATLTAKTITDIEAAISRTTMPASYIGTVGATVSYTGISASDGTTVLTARTSSGISLVAGISVFNQDVTSGIGAFIARWDEGDPLTYVQEYIVVSGAFQAGFNTIYPSAAAAPTSGTYGTGNIVYNSAPVAGGNTGWICVSGGTPGTWKQFGPIEA